MFILKTGHQPGVYMPLRALFLVIGQLQAHIDAIYSYYCHFYCCENEYFEIKYAIFFISAI